MGGGQFHCPEREGRHGGKWEEVEGRKGKTVEEQGQLDLTYCNQTLRQVHGKIDLFW